MGSISRNVRRIGIAAALVAAIAGGAQAKTTLLWWNVIDSVDRPRMMNTYKALAEAYMKAHPDVAIQEVPLTDDEMGDKLASVLAAGAGVPDVFTYYFAADSARNGWFEDLTPYLKRDHIDPATTWFPIARLRGVYLGKQYSLPRDVGPAGLGYDKDVFDQYGLAYPSENYDVDRFTADLKKLAHPDDGIYPLDLTLNQTVGALEWSPLASNLNVQFVSPDGAQVKGYLDSADTLRTFDWWAGLHRTGVVTTDPSLPFWSGKVGFGSISLWEVADIRKAEMNWGIHPGPTWPGGSPRVWADSVQYYMYSGSQHKDAAWQFMKWLSTSVDAARVSSQTFAWAPPNLNDWQALGLQADPDIGRFWTIANMPTQVANYLISQHQWDIIDPPIEEAWQQAVDRNNNSASALLKAAVPAIQAQLDAANAS